MTDQYTEIGRRNSMFRCGDTQNLAGIDTLKPVRGRPEGIRCRSKRDRLQREKAIRVSSLPSIFNEAIYSRDYMARIQYARNNREAGE